MTFAKESVRNEGLESVKTAEEQETLFPPPLNQRLTTNNLTDQNDLYNFLLLYCHTVPFHSSAAVSHKPSDTVGERMTSRSVSISVMREYSSSAPRLP